jgi:hypothetical protein
VLLAVLFVTRKDLLGEAKTHKNNHCISKAVGMKKKLNFKPKGFIKTILMVLIWIGQLFFSSSAKIFFFNMILSRGFAGSEP